jgi:hypothetical protein
VIIMCFYFNYCNYFGKIKVILEVGIDSSENVILDFFVFGI